MRMTSRLVGVAAAMSLLLGLLALPAAAYDIVVFAGRATVCADTVTDTNNVDKPPADGCPNENKQNGLYLVGHPNGKNEPITGLRIPDPNSPKYHDKWKNREGNYRFQSTAGTVQNCQKFNPLADTGPVPCEIDVSGLLAPVDVAGQPIGASCGMSEGLSGDGFIEAQNDSRLEVSEVGWPASAGGTLPITGEYEVTNAKEKPGQTPKPGEGIFVGVVQAQGGGPCVKSNATGKSGASTFNVVGVAAMLVDA